MPQGSANLTVESEKKMARELNEIQIASAFGDRTFIKRFRYLAD